MKIPLPNIMTITVLREICGARGIYLSRLGERGNLLQVIWFLAVCIAVILAFKAQGYSVKLHTFFRGDADRELHDHPWPFWSLVVMGEYEEVIPPCQLGILTPVRERIAPFHPVQDDQGNLLVIRRVGDLDFRPCHWRHRVTLPDNQPCVTLVFTGKKKREWGFHTARGWVPWFRFVAEKEDREDC